MTININLLPWRQERKELEKKQFLALIAGFAGLSGAIVFGVHILFSQQITNQKGLNEYLQSEIKVLDKKIAEIDAIQQEKERLLARMDIIQQLQSNRPHVVRLFDNLVRTIPDGLFLLSLNRTDSLIAIEGKAESNTRVSKFMRNIDSSDWLTSPLLNVIQADDKEDESVISFTLQAIQVTKEE